jgi:YVTN family beta-propeller protein
MPLIAALLAAALALAACSSGGDDDGTGAGGCVGAGSISVGSKPWAVATDAAANRLYSANEFDNTISVVDLCTHATIATLPSGTGPNSISVNHKSGVAFISNFNSNDVTVIQADQVIQTIPVGQAPWAVLADEDANVAYVANSRAGGVMILDAAESRPVGVIGAFKEPRGLARLGRTLYVADAADNVIRAINLDTLEPAGEATVGQRPQGIALDAAANRLWVTNVDDATVSVIDLVTMAVVETIPVGLSPLQIAVVPQRHRASAVADGRAYTTDSFADTITVIDTESLQVIATYRDVKKPWDVEISEDGLYISEDGLYIYVANSATSEIKVFSPEQLVGGG